MTKTEYQRNKEQWAKMPRWFKIMYYVLMPFMILTEMIFFIGGSILFVFIVHATLGYLSGDYNPITIIEPMTDEELTEWAMKAL